MSQHSHDPACLFCKIVQGIIPSSKVLETDHVVAFLDVNPVNLGHVLLVPKAHHATLADLPDHLAAETATLVPNRLPTGVRLQPAGRSPVRQVVGRCGWPGSSARAN